MDRAAVSDPGPLPPSDESVGAQAPAASVPVWDAAVRVFHWSLVALVVTAWISGGSGERLHEIVGYAVAGLIAFRVLWGFIGTRYARFRDFVCGPRTVAGYLSGIARLKPSHHTGHNPAGAAMILVLLGVLVTIAVSGAMMQSSRFFGVEWVERVHSLAADSLLVIVPLHVLGALVSSWLHQENLVRAMFSGTKRAPEGHVTASLTDRLEFRLKGAEGLFALSILAACGAFYGWVSTMNQAATGPSAPVAVPAMAVVDELPLAQAAVATATPAPAPASAATPAAAAVAVAAQTKATPTPSSRPMVDLQDYMTGGPEQPSQLWVLASGGRLYDRWYAALGKKGPTTNHPSWPADNTNISGAETWRCKNCHGWDYLGRDGLLKSGPGATGIRGVQRMRGRPVEDVVAMLENETHQYTDELIPGHAKRRLATFISQGQHTVSQHLYPNGDAKGNAVVGRNLFQTLCAACHGFEGKARKLGGSGEPSYVGKPLYVGNKARTGPSEVLHKIRNGHPGVPMISMRGLSMQSAADVLAYARQLPTE
jgi:cytochrome b/mono/diheme cytochrome c family protein